MFNTHRCHPQVSGHQFEKEDPRGPQTCLSDPCLATLLSPRLQPQWSAPSVTTTSRYLRALPVWYPCLATPSGLMPHLRRFLPRPARPLFPSSTTPSTRRANATALPPPLDCVPLLAVQNHLSCNSYSVNSLMREGTIQMTKHSQGLTPEAIQESDPKAGGGEYLPPSTLPPAKARAP